MEFLGLKQAQLITMLSTITYRGRPIKELVVCWCCPGRLSELPCNSDVEKFKVAWKGHLM